MKTRSILTVSLLVAMFGGLIVHTQQGAADTWKTAGTSGNWNDGTKWTDGSFPVAADTATHSIGGTYTVTFTAAPTAIQNLAVSLGTVTFTSSGGTKTLNIDQTTNALGNDFNVTGGVVTLGTSGNAVIFNMADGLNVSGGTLNVNFGSDVVANGSSNIGAGTNGTVIVDGSGSLYNATGGLGIGSLGTAGTLTFQNSATGSIGNLVIASGGTTNSTGTLNVLSGAAITTTTINLGVNAITGQVGTLNVNGAGSSLTQTGGVALTVGAATLSSASINIGTTNTGGTFNSGTSTITVNATGSINIGSGANTGTFNANGNVNINGGQFSRANASSTFTLASTKTLTVQAGGDATFAGAYTTNNALHLVTGSGSTLVTTGGGTLSIDNGGTLSVQSSAFAGPNGALNMATNLGGTLTVDSSNFAIGAASVWSNNGATATATFSNAAQFIISTNTITLASGAVANTVANVTIQSGADWTNGGSIIVGNNIAAGSSATLTVTGSGSSIVQTFGALTVGTSGAGAINGTLNLNSAGAFTTISSTTTVNARGKIDINGGTLNANGDILLDGGQLTRQSTVGSAFNWAASKTMAIQNGGTFTSALNYFTPSGAVINVTGSGSSFNMTNLSGLTLINGGQINATTGGDITAAGIDVGNTAAGDATVDGSGSTLTVSSTTFVGSAGGVGNLTLRNGATAALADVAIANSLTAGTTGAWLVQSGATATLSSNLSISANGGATTDGSVTVEGIGSTVTLSSGTLFFGHASTGTAELTVQNGGSFTAPATTLNATGELNITLGTVNLGTLANNGGTVNFNSGSLTFIGNLTVGIGGLLGNGDVTLDTDKSLTLSGTTTISTFQTLAITGGKLSTGSLVVNGTLDLEDSGTLIITGAGGLTIGSGGPLGSNPTFSNNVTLNVTNTLTVNSGSTATLNGANLIAGALVNSGSIVLDSGTVTAGALTNNAGAFAFVGQNKTATFNGASTNAGEIQFGGAVATLAGTGTLTNTGLIRGDGRLTKPVTNSTNGEIRAELGKRVKLEGTNGTNVGKINLQNGTAEFTQALNNGSAGLITGRGTLIVGGIGLINQGNIAFSSGLTDVFGDVLNNTSNVAKGIQVSGNADVTFWDDVVHNAGSLFNVSSGSSVTFFGTYGGVGITGGGTKNFEGDITPGFSPGIAAFGGNTNYGPNVNLEIEIGGLTPGFAANQHDQVTVAGNASLDGTLTLTDVNGFVPVAGDRITAMTFGSRTGTFATVTTTTPTAGLTYSAVYSATDLVILTTTTGEKTWGINAAGNSSSGANWIGGVAPGGVGETAAFTTIITANRIVTIDAPTTVGTLKFDDDNNYTLSGASTLTLQNTGLTSANITVQNTHGNGAHSISAPITLASDLNIAQNSAGTFTISGAINDTANKSITKTGTGTLSVTTALNLNAGNFAVNGGAASVTTLDGTGTTSLTANALLTADYVRQAALTLAGTAGNNTGKATIRQSAGNSPGLDSTVSRVTTLSIASDPLMSPPSVPYPTALRTYYATLDLTNNDLIINNPGNSMALLGEVTDMIRGGMGNTTALPWTGNGLTSSYAQNGNPLFGKTGLGVVRNITNPALVTGPALYTNFDGQSTPGNEILVKYTWYGDFDLDGKITSFDFALLDAGFAGTTQQGGQPGWFFGDANLDGQVNSFDYALTATGYGGYVAAAPNNQLPEPSTLVLAALGLVGLLAARRHSRSNCPPRSAR